MRRPSVVGMHEFSADADADAQAAARPPGGPRHSGRRHVSLKEHQVIEAGAAEERFALSADVKCPHDGSGSPVRLHGGNLRIRGDRGSEHTPPHWLADVIVDGDLVIDGGPDWWEGDGGQYKVPTGDRRSAGTLRTHQRLCRRCGARRSAGGRRHPGPWLGRPGIAARRRSSPRRGRCHHRGVHGDVGQSRGGRPPCGDRPAQPGRELAELIRPELLDDADDTDDPLGRELGDRIEAAPAAGMPVLRDTPGPHLTDAPTP